MQTSVEDVARLERDLEVIRQRWAEPGYAQRTTSAVLDQERQVHHELVAQLETLRARLVAQQPAGGLSSPSVGLWAPLALFEGGAAEGAPIQVPQVEETTLDYAELERQVFDLVLAYQGEIGASTVHRDLGRLVSQWAENPQARRLLAAAWRSTGKVTQAVKLMPNARQVTERPWAEAHEHFLTKATELPDEFDGLTATQRTVLNSLKQSAPPGSGFMRLSDIVAEMRANGVVPSDMETVERVLISLGHPSLRRLPLVEFQGLSGRFDPPDISFTHARLSRVGLEAIENTLAVPLLLVNGAEGIGSCIPPHNPTEMIDSCLQLLGRPLAHVNFDMSARAVDFPGGADVLSTGGHSLWKYGEQTLTAFVRVELQIDAAARRCRILLHHFPWPLRADDVAHRIREAITAGEVDGISSVTDDSTVDEVRVTLDVEHLAFSRQIMGYLATSKVCEYRIPAKLAVKGNLTNLTTDLIELLRAFVEHRKEIAVKSLDSNIAHALTRARQAEAICLALELLEPVLEAMRRTDDDQQAAEALTQFLKPEHRAALTRLPFPASHAYERGFTLEQARHLVAQRKLKSRGRDEAAREWARLLNDVEEAKQALSSRANILEVVRTELTAARARFGEPRRSKLR